MHEHPDNPAQPIALTCEQSRRVDQLAVEQLGIPSIVLMENAAINAVNALMDALEIERQIKPFEACVNVFCGGGNNAGDGYAMARHLHNWGAEVRLFAFKPVEKLSGDAWINADICRHMNLPITSLDSVDAMLEAVGMSQQAHAVVDALLGTGFQGELRSPLDDLLRHLDTLEGPLRMAVDTPSGLHADRGTVAAGCFKADVTVTFVAEKVGFRQAAARDYLGRVLIADIGIPDSLIHQVLAS